MTSEEEHLDYQFLSDKPLGEGDQINFGHDGIASAIVEMVNCCEGTLNIGLFGRWGTGKSTIANAVDRMIRGMSQPVVVFDVWKHESDNLRSSFLRECCRQLKDEKNKALRKGYKLSEHLDQDIAEPEEEDVTFFSVRFLKTVTHTAAYALGAVVLIVLLLTWSGKQQVVASWDSAFVITAIIAIFGILFGPFVNRLQKPPKYRFVSRFHDPHEFQDEFERLLSEVNADRILFIFDNLDRVTHEASVGMLSMIKTFLEPTIKNTNVTFLIPCDDRAIREHICQVYLNGRTSDIRDGKASSFKADEFLKKFFNTTIWIPEFIPSELRLFVRECLQETNVAVFDDAIVEWLIVKTYRENPRQTKQFINTLLSNFILAQKREAVQELPDGFSNGNIRELCLYLLLQVQFPKEMESLKSNKVFRLLKDEDDDATRRKEFWDFVESAYTVVSPINDLKPYRFMRISGSEKMIPGITELIVLLSDGKLEEANKRADGIPEFKQKPTEFNAIILDELDRITNPIAASHLINGALHIALRFHIEVTHNLKLQIRSTVLELLDDHIDIVSPDAFLLTGILDDATFGNKVVGRWLRRVGKIIEEEKAEGVGETSGLKERVRSSRGVLLLKNLITVLTKRPTIGSNSRDIQKQLVSDHLFDQVDSLTSLLNVPELAENVIDDNLARKYIDQLVEYELPGDPDSCLESFVLLNKLASLSESDLVAESGLKSYIELLSHLNSLDSESDQASVYAKAFDLLDEFMEGIGERLGNPAHAPTVLILDETISKVADNLPESVSSAVKIVPQMTLSDHIPEPARTQLTERLNKWMSECTAVELRFVLDKFQDEREFVEQSSWAPMIMKNAINEASVMSEVYSIVGNEHRTKLLTSQIEENPDAALITIETFKQSLPRELNIPEVALEKSEQASALAKVPYLKIAAHLSCDNNTGMINKYVLEILELLKSTTESVQAAGLSLFIDSEFVTGRLMYPLVKGAFEWLKSSTLTNKFQPSVLKAILYGVDEFTPYEKGELSQFCWDELIGKSEDLEAIQAGFETLALLGTSYDKNWKNSFHLVLQRAENTETSEELRAELRAGLLRLKSKKMSNKEESGFYESVEALGGG